MMSSSHSSSTCSESGLVVLATCSGFCNVGQLTTQAALFLIRRFPGKYTWLKAEKGKSVHKPETQRPVYAIVGCEDCCACDVLKKSGVQYSKTVIATDLGIPRDPHGEVTFEQISTFAEKINS